MKRYFFKWKIDDEEGWVDLAEIVVVDSVWYRALRSEGPGLVRDEHETVSVCVVLRSGYRHVIRNPESEKFLEIWRQYTTGEI